MIEGIGVDVIEIPRIRRAIDIWGSTFLDKVFSSQELAYAESKKNSVPHIAARFAVKEAVAKAMSTGWSRGFRWKDVEVENDSSGKPQVHLHGEAGKWLDGRRVLVSISHSENVVVAFAVIESKSKN
jgi:holo-[acyl-carrier-protein] synthase